jgi:hypothetical protein
VLAIYPRIVSPGQHDPADADQQRFCGQSAKPADPTRAQAGYASSPKQERIQ